MELEKRVKEIEKRNKRVELNISNEFSVDIKIDNDEIKNLVINLLKLKDKVGLEVEGVIEKVKVSNIEIDITYDNSKNEEAEREILMKEKSSLENSIARREKLLSNENYLSKAPSNIVMAEKESLSKEIEKLNIIKNKLGEV